jgi:general nucleoside transport system permease protein
MLASLVRSTDGLVSGTISATIPILLAALGGMYTYYSGIFNIAMEGMMLSGAFGAVVGSYYAQSWVVGILGGIGGAMVLAVIYILFVVVWKTDEFVTGIALNLGAVGATTFLLRRIFHTAGAFASSPDKSFPGVPVVRLHVLDGIPIIRAIVSGHTVLDWLAVFALGLSVFVVRKTRFGLRLRAAGYNASSLSASGVSTPRVRTISVVLCAVLCGLAGAFLSIGYLQVFGENMSNGRGWIALAAIVLVKGRPGGVAAICLLFGFASSIALKAQSVHLPTQFSDMFPYLITLVALFVYARRHRSSRVSRTGSA